MERLKAHAGAKPAGPLQSVETMFAAMFVTDDAARSQTFNQLWALQKRDGLLSGGWQWLDANLDPWETPAQFAMARRSRRSRLDPRLHRSAHPTMRRNGSERSPATCSSTSRGSRCMYV